MRAGTLWTPPATAPRVAESPTRSPVRRRRHERIDALEMLGGNAHVAGGEQPVELRHGARPDDRRGDGRLDERPRGRIAGERDAELPGEPDELFDDLEPPARLLGRHVELAGDERAELGRVLRARVLGDGLAL